MTDRPRWTVVRAETASEVALAGALFAEYGASPRVRACVTSLDREVVALPGDYAPPGGRLLLALSGGEVAAGCVGVRRHDARRAEMKRLYVRPPFRGTGLGRVLAAAALEEAWAAGYEEVLLDTLPTMIEAIALYRSLGFRRVAPYGPAPTPGALHFALSLGGA